MSVKLSSITTAATRFNFGKSNLYDFIFFKSCHFITFCISSLHHWVSFLLLFHARYFCKQFSASTLFCHHSSFDDIWEELKKRDRYIFECLNLNFEMWHLYFSHTEFFTLNIGQKLFQMKQKKVSIVFWRENENSKVRKCVVNQPMYFWEKMLKKVNFESQYHKFIIARAMLSAHSEILWPVMTTPSVFTRDLNWIGVFQAVFLKLTPSILIRSVAGVFQMGDLTLHFSYFP